MVAGAADKVVTAWMGDRPALGPLEASCASTWSRASVALEEWSHLGLGLRFRAAAMGVPFLPTLTMLGSDLMGVGGSKTIGDPYTGETLHAVPALFPDVALLHVQSRRPLRQLPDRRLPAHGRRHRPRRRHRARDGGGDRDRGGDPAASRPHRHPRLRRGRARARARSAPIRTSAAASTTPTRPLRRVHRRHRRRAACDGGRATTSSATSTRRRRYADYLDLFGGERARARAATRARELVLVTATAHAVTANELLAVMGSRQLKDDTTVFAGVGVPLLAAALAQRRHAPRLTMVIEGGIIGPQMAARAAARSPPTRCAPPIARRCCRASPTRSCSPSAASSTTASWAAPRSTSTATSTRASSAATTGGRRSGCPARGGANDIVSLCREVIILTAHEKRRFVAQVDFVTSPGWLQRRRLAPREPGCCSAASRAW